MQFVEDELEKRPEAVQMEALLDARPDNGDMLSGDELAAPPSACFDACGDELMEVTSSLQSSSGGAEGGPLRAQPGQVAAMPVETWGTSAGCACVRIIDGPAACQPRVPGSAFQAKGGDCSMDFAIEIVKLATAVVGLVAAVVAVLSEARGTRKKKNRRR